ncbi:hypothetical protein AX16_007692 [Volvariella volvacea WC 439]|nr:hypothetical protein AX16_007692 [Volvariella volvacea WC 439]
MSSSCYTESWVHGSQEHSKLTFAVDSVLFDFIEQFDEDYCADRDPIDRARDCPTPSSEIHGSDGYDDDEKYIPYSQHRSSSSYDFTPTATTFTLPPRPPNPIFNQRPSYYPFFANLSVPESPSSVRFTDIPTRSHRSRINRPRLQLRLPLKKSSRSWRGRTRTRVKMTLLLSIVIVCAFIGGLLGGLRIADAESQMTGAPGAFLQAENINAVGIPPDPTVPVCFSLPRLQGDMPAG